VKSRRARRLARAGLFFGAVFMVHSQSVTQVGYTVVTGSAGSAVPVSTALFAFTNSSGTLVSEAGVGAAVPIASGRIFVDESGTFTSIALVNPSPRAGSVTFVLRDSSGRQVGSTTRTLGPGEHLAQYVRQLFPAAAPSGFSGTLQFTSNEKLAAITLRETRNVYGESLFTTLPVVDDGAAVSSDSLVFPQIAAGAGYTTQLLLMNTSSRNLSGRVRFTDSEGRPLVLRSGGSDVSEVQYSVEPNGSFRASLDRTGGLGRGYAVALPDIGSSSPAGSAIFRFQQDGSAVTEAGVAAAAATTSARIFVDNASTYTGVALANPSDSPATVVLDLLDRYGGPIDSASRTLPARGHIAIFAHELFPDLASSFTGLLEISSTVAVAPVTLKLTINARGDSVLSTLPVADLTRPPAASSIVFPQIAVGGGFTTRLVFINASRSIAAGGTLAFFRSNGAELVLPLAGKTASSFSYDLAAGAGRQLRPGNAATIASIVLPRELTLNEGKTARPEAAVVDSAGATRDDFDLSFSSLSSDVAGIDSAGVIQAKKAGFSTLTASSGGVLGAATVTVVAVSSGVTGYQTTGVAADLARRLYLANTSDHTILRAPDLKQSPELYAGVAKTAGLKNDVRAQSLFRNPAFVALHQTAGTLWVSDSANNAIRSVEAGPSGKVATIAAGFENPQGLALDNRGFLWIADSGSHTIKKLNLASGAVSIVAGKAGAPGWIDGSRDAARFSSPTGLALETEALAERLERERKGLAPPQPSVIVADTGNNALRRVRDDGSVETLRTSSASAAAGSTAAFSSPAGVAVDPFGNIYVSEPDSDRVSTLLRSGEIVHAAQPRTFSSPRGLAVAQGGRVVIAERSRSAAEIAYGEPRIASVTPARLSNRGGTFVTVRGKNFAPETVVVAGGVLIAQAAVVDTETLTFTTPALPSGRGTLTIQNRGGLAQTDLVVDAIPLSSLAPGQITTVAGGASFAGDGAAATAARLAFPTSVAVDASGDLLIADRHNNRIRRVLARNGIIFTIAGTDQPGTSKDGIPAIGAPLNGPMGVAVDLAGNIYIADSGNYRICRVAAGTGLITRIAGGGDPADRLGDGKPALEAAVSFVQGIVVDAAGNLFIADTGNDRIRRVDARTQIITTIAGNGRRGFSGDNAAATAASLNLPEGIAIDAAGNVWVADTGNFRVRRVDAVTGNISTVAGTGTLGLSGDGQAATLAQVDPSSVALDVEGNLWIADRANERVRRVDARTGIITSVAATTDAADPLRFVHGVSVDGSGNLFIADTGNDRVRKVPALVVSMTIVAGAGNSFSLGDNSSATAALLKSPLASVVDAAGNLYVSDSDNNRVRRVAAGSGTITTFAGTGEETFSGDGLPATSAALVRPAGLALDAAGNLYIAASGNHRIRRVDAGTGIITTVAGNGDNAFGGDGGPATLAALNGPNGVAIDGGGSIYVADTLNDRIRRIDAAARTITTVAGGGSTLGDNRRAIETSLNAPSSIALDSGGNLYITDTYNHRVRRVDPGGIITTVAGTGIEGSGGDGGLATRAQLSAPKAVAVDNAGNLYVADGNNVIRRIEARTQLISTVIGTGEASFSGDNGAAATATLGFPYGVAVDRLGNVFVSDTFNHRVRAVRGPLP
jgi:sugar lactone lactonase YvrE